SGEGPLPVAGASGDRPLGASGEGLLPVVGASGDRPLGASGEGLLPVAGVSGEALGVSGEGSVALGGAPAGFLLGGAVPSSGGKVRALEGSFPGGGVETGVVVEDGGGANVSTPATTIAITPEPMG